MSALPVKLRSYCKSVLFFFCFFYKFGPFFVLSGLYFFHFVLHITELTTALIHLSLSEYANIKTCFVSVSCCVHMLVCESLSFGPVLIGSELKPPCLY